MSSLDRRRFLQTSAALGGSLLANGIDRPTRAATRIEVPAVDRIVVQEVTDGAHDVFLRGSEQPGLAVQRTSPNAVQGKTLHSEWGLALHIESQRGGEARRYLLDFGFTPEAYANNLEIMKIDPARGRCADPQPRALRPLWRSDRLPRGTPTPDAQGSTPLYRGRGHLLPARRPHPGWQLHRSCRARPPPAEGTECGDCAVGDPCGNRGSRLYDRRGVAHQHRARIAKQL